MTAASRKVSSQANFSKIKICILGFFVRGILFSLGNRGNGSNLLLVTPNSVSSQFTNSHIHPKVSNDLMLGAWSEGGGAWSWFPCYCFHFLSVLTSADVRFRRQRSKGSCEWMETVPPFVPSFIWVVHTLQIFPKQTWKNKGSKKPMTWWVSKAQKTNNGTESDTGRDLTSRPVRHLTPIMCFASVYLPTFFTSYSLEYEDCPARSCFQFTRPLRIWKTSC